MNHTRVRVLQHFAFYFYATLLRAMKYMLKKKKKERKERKKYENFNAANKVYQPEETIVI